MKRKLFTFAFLMVLLGTVMDFSSVDALEYYGGSIATQENLVDGGVNGNIYVTVHSVKEYNPGRIIVNVKDTNNISSTDGKLGESMVCANCGAWLDTIGQHQIEYDKGLAAAHPTYVKLFNNGIGCNGSISSFGTCSTQIYFKETLYKAGDDFTTEVK